MATDKKPSTEQLTGLLTTDFILGDAIKYFNAILNHSRFLIDILVRLGVVLLLQKLSISLYFFLGIVALGIAAVVFLLRSTWRDAQNSSIENAAENDIEIHPNSQKYLLDLKNRLNSMLNSERHYINNVTNFLDVNVFCTFLFFTLSFFTPITTQIVLSVFLFSFITATFLHRYPWLRSMEEEDGNFIKQIDKLVAKCQSSPNGKNLHLKPGPSLSMLLIHSTFLSSLSLSLLLMLPENTLHIIIGMISTNIWLIALPSALIIGGGLYFSTKFRQTVFSAASMITTTSVLILMGYKYLDLFPIARSILFFHIGPFFLFKIACLFIGVLTGLISYRTFTRNNCITEILTNAKPLPAAVLEKKSEQNPRLPLTEEQNHGNIAEVKEGSGYEPK